MHLTQEQERVYETALEAARREIEEADMAIQYELSRLKDRLAELQRAKRTALQMYDAACRRLGRSNDLKGDVDEEELGLG